MIQKKTIRLNNVLLFRPNLAGNRCRRFVVAVVAVTASQRASVVKTTV